MYNPGYMQVLNCLDNIRKCLVASPAEQHECHNGASAGPIPTTGIRGGDSVGGNAISDFPDGEAQGGSAAGGDVEISSPSYRGGVPLVGGSGTGGSATGHTATGGSGFGGSVRWTG